MKLLSLSCVAVVSAVSAVGLAGRSAQAAIITQVYTFAPEIIAGPFTGTEGNTQTSSDHLYTATTPKFDPSLGVLTSVSVDFLLNARLTVVNPTNSMKVGIGTQGGQILSDSGVVGGFGGGNGGPAMPFDTAIIPLPLGGNFTVDATVPGALDAFQGAGVASLYFVGAGMLSADPGATSTLSLLSGSSATFTYTYNAIPEPAALPLLGVAGLATLRRRR